MRLAATALGVVMILVGACHLLLPERYAVNAPIRHMLFGTPGEAPAADAVAERMVVPDGFHIGIWADGIENARFMRATATGDILVSQPRQGRVVRLLPDADGDGGSDGRAVLIEGLNRPHGLDLWEGWLYIAETDAVGRIRYDVATGQTSGAFERVVTGLPGGENHWTRTVRFGPDGYMYVSVGSTCNVCEEADERRAALLRYRPDGSDYELYATGLRNAVGFDWQPGTGDLYATDNGRDLLGDDLPPCELNLVVRGGDYGWPYAYGDRVPDPDFGPGNEERVAASLPQAHPFRAHNAPLGIAFVRGAGAPASVQGAALVALHGSWNRTSKDGYKVVSLHWDDEGAIEERDFVTGFLVDGDVIGRPVDVVEGADGAFYVSDDYAGVVWRVGFGDAPRGAATSRSAPASIDPLAAFSDEERNARAARGSEVYQRNGCAACHDAEAAAEGVVTVPLRELAARYDVPKMEAFMAAPTPPMPAFELPAEDARDLAVYLLDQ